MSSRAVVRGAALVVAGLCLVAGRLDGQPLSRVSLDSVGAADLFKGDGTTGRPDLTVDVSSVIRINDQWSVQLRPWFFRSSADNAEWMKEMYGAAVRYERPGTTSLRVDAGYIPMPIGLGMLDMRADTNPTILPHLSYFMPLLPFDRGAPQVGAIASSYPLGAIGTLSGTRWDARAGVMNTAPTRRYALNVGIENPRSTPVGIVGAGVSPVPGMRIGGSVAAGTYATAREVADGTAGRVRMWTGEAEYAFAYTRLAAEVTREQFTRGSVGATSGTWFVQGVQTISPRWFVSGRVETIDAPHPIFLPGSGRLTFRMSETSAGFRLSPDLTLRGSFATNRFYTATSTDRRVGAQIVWSHRWW